jgi:hypothetical protein
MFPNENQRHENHTTRITKALQHICEKLNAERSKAALHLSHAVCVSLTESMGSVLKMGHKGRVTAGIDCADGRYATSTWSWLCLLLGMLSTECLQDLRFSRDSSVIHGEIDCLGKNVRTNSLAHAKWLPIFGKFPGGIILRSARELYCLQAEISQQRPIYNIIHDSDIDSDSEMA